MSIAQLSDFEPKGAACRAFDVYHPGGFPQRALVIIGPDARRAVELSGASPGELPGANLIFDGLGSRPPAGLSELGSAPVPDSGRGRPRPRAGGRAAGDRVRRLRVPVLRGADRAAGRAARCGSVFRHFPVRSSHPRAWPAACAAEAAGLQGRFWEMHDLLFADQARLEDPHLWERARALGLDLERFDADRRSDAVRERDPP